MGAPSRTQTGDPLIKSNSCYCKINKSLCNNIYQGFNSLASSFTMTWPEHLKIIMDHWPKVKNFFSNLDIFDKVYQIAKKTLQRRALWCQGEKVYRHPGLILFQGLRSARLNFRQLEEMMENIFFNELKIRDFNVDVDVAAVNGSNKNGAVFLADDRRCFQENHYYQRGTDAML